jgi:hypothetical protein
MIQTEYLIRWTALHKNFFFIFMKCLIPIILGIILIPAISAGLPAGDSATITHNDGIALEISSPVNGEIFWIDVVPPHIMVIGNARMPQEIRSIRVKSGTGITDCGNLTEFSCDVPVSSGKSMITIMVTDVSGNSTEETRNFTVNIGLPPPVTISLKGKITDQQGVPLANVSVSSESSLTLDNKPFVVHTQTQNDGTYLIQDAIGYRQKISVEKEGYVPLAQEIIFENTTNELNFDLRPRLNFTPGFGFFLCIVALSSGLLITYRRRRSR